MYIEIAIKRFLKRIYGRRKELTKQRHINSSKLQLRYKNEVTSFEKNRANMTRVN